MIFTRECYRVICDIDIALSIFQTNYDKTYEYEEYEVFDTKITNLP